MAECELGRKAAVKFNRDKTFLCIDYPAVVNHVDKMLETLGGEKHVSEVYSDPQLRFDLKFRPRDVHCKPMYGDKVNTTRLLLKIRRKKSRPSNVSSSTEPVSDAEPCTSEILGIVDQTYKFKSMADFQYLPMINAEGSGYTSIVDKLVPSSMHPSSWLYEESPLLLTPLIFSRIDNPCDYHFRKDPNWQKNTAVVVKKDDGLISRIRQKRSGYTIFANYDEKTIPDKPHEDASKVLSMKSCTRELIEQVKQAFEERPIWSRNALLSKITLGYKAQLKYILPIVAYYFITGPWRSLWVRFGYDPRKEPAAKMYQLLDFRVRKHIGREKVPVSGNRPGFYNILPIKFVNQSHTKTATIDKENFARSSLDGAADGGQSPDRIKSKVDSSYIFGEGVMPPRRQMFYQLCDVHLSEVQKLIHDNDGHETKCTEKDGWCNTSIPEKCRNIMIVHVEQLMAAEEGREPKEMDESRILDQSSDSDSEEDQDSDDSANEIIKILEGMKT